MLFVALLREKKNNFAFSFFLIFFDIGVGTLTKENHVTPLLNFSFKGTVSVISSDPWCKNGNARLPTVPLVTLIWLKVMKKPSFFRLEKGLILMISLRFLKARKVQNSLLQETTNQNKQLKKKHGYIIHAWSDKAL